MVPGGAPTSFRSRIFPPSTIISVPISSLFSRVIREKRETAAMLGSASPLKPRVLIEKRSLSVDILLVAYRSMARSASSRLMPVPVSETRMSDFPPCSTSIRIRLLSASNEFSISSLTTEAGRSTTSPAAILLDRISGRIFILDM